MVLAPPVRTTHNLLYSLHTLR